MTIGKICKADFPLKTHNLHSCKRAGETALAASRAVRLVAEINAEKRVTVINARHEMTTAQTVAEGATPLAAVGAVINLR